MDWQQRIPGCFGNVDGLFAVHPMDLQRACQLLQVLVENQIGWEQVRKAFLDYIEGNNQSPDRIEKHMARIEKHMKPWLS